MRSFRKTGGDYFISRNILLVSCPPYVIAKLAIRHETELPEGYDTCTLERIMSITGWTEYDVSISPRQAAELVMIGKQLAVLHEAGKISLTFFQEQSIRHMIREVEN